MNEPVPGRTGRVHQVNVSRGGVPKLPVERAHVRHAGLDGDGHNTPEPDHGGPDRAVVLYALEAIGRVIADGNIAFPGAFGENLTLEGIDWGGLRESDRMAIGVGGLLIELVRYATPCDTLAQYFTGGRFARISHRAHPEDSRWCARVLVEGAVATGDRVEVLPPQAPPAGPDSPG